MVLYELKETILWKPLLLGVWLCVFPFVLPHLQNPVRYWWNRKIDENEEKDMQRIILLFFKIAGCIALIVTLAAFIAQCRKNEEIREIYQKYEVRWATGCVEDYKDLPDDRQTFRMDGKKYVLYSYQVNLIREGQYLKIGYYYDPAILARRVTYAEELMTP